MPIPFFPLLKHLFKTYAAPVFMLLLVISIIGFAMWDFFLDHMNSYTYKDSYKAGKVISVVSIPHRIGPFMQITTEKSILLVRCGSVRVGTEVVVKRYTRGNSMSCFDGYCYPNN